MLQVTLMILEENLIVPVKHLDNKGQSSAEIILLIGGIIAIVIVVGSYIININYNIENKTEQLLNKERNFVINKI